jgi:transposase
MSYRDHILTPTGTTSGMAETAARTAADEARRSGHESALLENLAMLGLITPEAAARPVTAQPEPSTARLCPKGLHDMDVHGRQRNDNRRWWCSACAYAAQKLARDAKRGIDTPTEPDPRLGPGERFCTCETPHIITVGNSDTTYVTPKTGKRRCRFARQRAQEIRKRAA